MKRFRSDTRGVAATEFAMLAPVMLLLFFGMEEISAGYAIKNKLSLISNSLGQMVSQNTNGITDAALVSAIFPAAVAVLYPYDVKPLKATVSEVYIDPDTGLAFVQFSFGDAPNTAGTVLPLPAGLTPSPRSYLIVSEVSYLYTPFDLVAWFVPSAGLTFTEIGVKGMTACVPYNVTVCTTTTGGAS